ncbi:Rubredoxin-1 [Chlorella vulgaris]
MPALVATPSSARLAGSKRFAGTAVQARPALPLRAPRAAVRTVAARAATSKATYICVDCGYLYDGSEGPFEKLPSSYRCPVCSAPKRRFKPYAGATGRNDSKSMNARFEKVQRGEGLAAGGKADNSSLAAGVVAGAVILGGLYFALSSYYN